MKTQIVHRPIPVEDDRIAKLNALLKVFDRRAHAYSETTGTSSRRTWTLLTPSKTQSFSTIDELDAAVHVLINTPK